MNFLELYSSTLYVKLNDISQHIRMQIGLERKPTKLQDATLVINTHSHCVISI